MEGTLRVQAPNSFGFLGQRRNEYAWLHVMEVVSWRLWNIPKPHRMRGKTPKNKIKSEIMKGIIHKEKGNGTLKEKNIDGKKP